MKISFDRSEVLSRSYKQIIIDLIDADNSNNIFIVPPELIINLEFNS